ncbi:alcohol dehydrogenase [Rhodohalobacter sp. SW132]|uniref:alcohol dehydrogenase n=1 Tax=Rhodohalobacter sp. SW132 TaxID=2293433 RepID=UPI000E232A6E|nr:alcohol dehydrogenase [Rhodohalobacter sp. SW132]REL25085.1 alcohol dehydrogenase [Rhodohalobacter sp. SW132]
MKAAQIKEAGGEFQIVDIPVPEPGSREVLIKVEACGICHSDAMVKDGLFPGIEYPRVPGHEVVGIVEEVGESVTRWNKGDRVGVGWHGGHCFTCNPCRSGDFINCENGKVAGISYDGGYADYMTAPEEAVAAVPDELRSEDAAPLLCAGITTFNSLKNTGAQAGDLVAVQGIGGLGHLAVQYAAKMGFKTAAISTSDDKEKLAKNLGAHHFINAKKQNAVEELQALGGARVIIATAPNTEIIGEIAGGLGVEGNLLVLAATGETFEVSPLTLIMGRKQISGWPSGTAKDSEDTLNFSAMTGTKPMIETYSLDQAGEAYARMINNEARFRVVLKMN